MRWAFPYTVELIATSGVQSIISFKKLEGK